MPKSHRTTSRMPLPRPKSSRHLMEPLEHRCLLSGNVPTLEVSGTVNLVFSSSTASDGTVTYHYMGGEADLSVNLNVPATVPIAVRAGVLGQSDLSYANPTIWDNPVLAVANAVNVVSNMSGPGAVFNIADTVDILKAGGPTERHIDVPGTMTANAVGGSATFSAGIDLKFDVTIPAGADVIMNQSPTIESLTIEQGGALSGNNGMVVRNDVRNAGVFTNLAGRFGDDFFNEPTGYASNDDISTLFVLADELFNYGELRMDSPLTLNRPTTNYGELHLTHSMTSPGDFINRGRMTMMNATSLDNAGRFINHGETTLDVATISSEGGLQNFGILSWLAPTWSHLTGGPESGGPCVLANAAGAVLNIDGAGLKLLTNYTIDNAGTINWGGTGRLQLIAYGAAQATTINNAAGGVFDLRSDADLTTNSGGGGAPRPAINNAGTFRKTGGGESRFDFVQFNNTGTTEIAAGTFKPSSTTLDTLAGTFRTSGAGAVNLDALTAPKLLGTFHGHNYNLGTDGRLDSTFTITGTLNWTAGPDSYASSRLDGSAFPTPRVLTIAAGAVLNIDGAGDKYLTNYTIDNAGTINLGGAGYLGLFADGTGQAATINNAAGGVFDLRSDADLRTNSGGGGAPRPAINNAGMFRKSGGGESRFDYVQFNNTGTAEIAAGTFRPTSTTLDTRNGTFRTSGAGGVDLTPAYYGTSPDLLGTFHGHNYNLGAGGSLDSTFTITGTLNWTAAAASDTSHLDSGVLTIAAGAVLNIDGAGRKQLTNYTIQNAGTINWGGTGRLDLASGAAQATSINNAAGGVFDLRSDADLQAYNVSGGPQSAINNAGTFRKSGGGESRFYDVAFNNTGTADVQAGTLNFATTFATGTFRNDGTARVRAGAAITGVGRFTQTAPGSRLDAEFAAAAGAAPVDVDGTVALAGGLGVSLGFTPTAGQTLVLINNDGTDPVAGTFAGLPEGATVTAGVHSMRISYVGGTGNDVVLTAVVPLDAAPAVTGVFVRGTIWSANFLNFLATSGQGDSTFGYRINALEQTDELPWVNLNRISIRFNENVNIAADDLVVRGIRNLTYPVAASNGFTYDPVTFTATWTLAASIAADKLLLDLDADAGGVTDANGNALDGEWTNPTAPANGGADTFPSGDGIAGGDFHFRLNVLPGDVNRSGGSVLGSDVTLTRNAQNSTPGAVNSLYTIFKDVNGSGSILGSDVTLVRNRQGSTLPAGEPVPPAPTAAAETTSVTDARTATINRSSLFATGPKVRSAMRLLASRFDLLGDAVEEPLVA